MPTPQRVSSIISYVEQLSWCKGTIKRAQYKIKKEKYLISQISSNTPKGYVFIRTSSFGTIKPIFPIFVSRI
jgi:hypothetical protein